MSLLLFDTTFLVDAERARDGLDDVIDDDDDVAIAAVTVAEMGVGVELATGTRRDKRQAFLDDVLASMPVLMYDVDIAWIHADLLAAVRRQGRPRGAHDLVIAATAKATGRMVITADTSAFEDLPGVAVGPHR